MKFKKFRKLIAPNIRNIRITVSNDINAGNMNLYRCVDDIPRSYNNMKVVRIDTFNVYNGIEIVLKDINTGHDKIPDIHFNELRDIGCSDITHSIRPSYPINLTNVSKIKDGVGNGVDDITFTMIKIRENHGKGFE